MVTHDTGVNSDDLHYLIPENYQSKHSHTFISVNGDFVRIEADLMPGVWNRFCFLVSKSIKQFSLFINEKKVYSADGYPAEFDAGNLWLLGYYEQGEGEAGLYRLHYVHLHLKGHCQHLER